MRWRAAGTEIVCVGFGLFFVFSVKQAPDRKMRNWRKSVQKPVVIMRDRLSIGTSNTSQVSTVQGSRNYFLLARLSIRATSTHTGTFGFSL